MNTTKTVHPKIAGYMSALQLIEDIRNDYQLDPMDENYMGFINVGGDLWVGEEQRNAWKLICSRPQFFEDLIESVGLIVEGGRINYDETVFSVPPGN